MLYLEELNLYVEKITTEQYLKYLNYVDDETIDNIEKKYLIISTLTGLNINKVQDVDIWDIDNIYCKLYLHVLESIEEKYPRICEDAMGIKPVVKEKSFFDEYDEENGYIEHEKELTESEKRIDLINYFIRYMSTNHKLSYDGFMKSDLSSLLDNIYYNFKFDRETKDE